MIKNNFDDIYYPENIEEILFKNVDEKMIDHIKRSNSKHLSETSMTFMGEKITYDDFFKKVDIYAKALKKYGLEKGDCITLAMPNIPETVYYFYACNDLGITAYLIDPRSTFNNMVSCINNSNSKLFICEMGTYYQKVSQNIDKVPVDNIVVVSPVNMFEKRHDINSKALIGRYIYDLKKFYETLKMLNKDKRKKYFQRDFIKLGDKFIGEYSSSYEPDIPAIIVNTSGTSGTSIKGAMHSNKTYNIFTNEAMFVTDQLIRGYSYYGYVPYFSMYGSGVGMHTALTHGVVIDNIPKFNGMKSLREIIDTKANILVGTPNIIEKLTDIYEKENLDASHIKQYIIGGDNVSPDTLLYENNVLLRRDMAQKLVYGYGTTESMPISTMNPDPRSHLDGSTGIVYPMAHIKVINPESLEELSYNEEGEIYVSNPTLMMGYLNNEIETEAVLKKIDGKIYYKTGDKGYLTESGHLFFTGRYKRMMKRPDGHQVSPIPIENSILKNSYVKDCAVVGIKRNNGKPGVIPTAFVNLENQDGMNNQDNLDKIVKNIAEESLQNLSGEREAALAYVIVDKIPYTLNGKTDFRTLEENVFDNLNFYVIEDAITIEYFDGLTNYKMLSINKANVRSLKKK